MDKQGGREAEREGGRERGWGGRCVCARAWVYPFASPYRGTSLSRKRTLLGLYRRPVPEVLGGSEGVGVFLWARHPCM